MDGDVLLSRSVKNACWKRGIGVAILGYIVSFTIASQALSSNQKEAATSFPSQSDDKLLAQLIRSLVPKYGSGFYRHPSSTRFGVGWSTAALTESSIFSKLRSSIEIEFAKAGNQTSRVVQKYFRDTISRVGDPRSVFAWAFASLLEAQVYSKVGKNYWMNPKGIQVHRMLEWLLASASPQSAEAEFVRIRFLVECGLHYRPELIPLGRRLLKVAPADMPVKRAMVYQLCNSRQVDDLDQAKALALELVKEKANGAIDRGCLLRVHLSRWLHLGKKEQDGREYLKVAKEYLQLIPSKSENAEGVRYTIGLVQKELGGDAIGRSKPPEINRSNELRKSTEYAN